MIKETASLIMYSNLGNDCILFTLAKLIEKAEKGEDDTEEIKKGIYEQILRILELATKYGFDDNLWQCYISYLLATNENPYSMICETVGAGEGSASQIVEQDMNHFYRLFHYDFSKVEKLLGIQCFSTITNYKSMAKAENTYNQSVSEKVRLLAKQMEQAQDAHQVRIIVTEFYKRYGVGKFGLNKAFRVTHGREEETILTPITHTSNVQLSDLVGYEVQKQQLVDNTEAFVAGKKANNVLLFGDSGTGKSTCIKAILNQYYDQGLRLVEIYKHQFKDLSSIIEQVKNRNYRFIIYMDDLSFEEFEIEYKYLKAVIEGGLEVKPDNVLIYATSNRRHLIRETWSDRSDMSKDELHQSDTMQEKLSLVARFGVSINFSKPVKRQYDQIILELAHRQNIQMSDQELLLAANAWSMRNGGFSGRVAEQFLTYIKGKESM